MGLGAVLVLAGCAGSGASDTEAKTGSDEARNSGPTVTVAGKDNFFEPSAVSVTAGQETTIRFTNKGAIPHTFTVKALGADTGIVNAGQSKDVKVKPSAGTLEITCTVHPDMKGQLTAS